MALLLRELTPASFIAAFFILIAILFILSYWYIILPRQGSLEWIAMTENQPKRLTFHLERYPMAKPDIFPLLLITVVYAATAFFQLGDTTAPQSFLKVSSETTVNFSLSQTTDISRVMYYTGLGTGEYKLEYVDQTGAWTSVKLDQAYNTLFKWETLEDENENPVPITAQVFRLTGTPKKDDLQLGELAFYDADGNLIPIAYADDAASALFDEQSVVPEQSTWHNSTYFDEIYHARTAEENIQNIYPYEVSHPPLGKLILSLGIRMFGMTPFGWRFMGTLFGVLMLPLLYVFLKNLFGKTAVAFCGTTLFAFDFMHLVQTRIATIDTYGVIFILAMYFFMYRWLTVPPDVKLRRSVLPLFLCGLMFGIGCACKWTAVYAGVGLAVLWVIGLILKKREWSGAPGTPGFAGFFFGTCALSVVFFIAIPLVIYCASYYPYAKAAGDTSLPNLLKIVWENQKFMLHYHEGVHDSHPYSSRWYQWLFDIRPILYYRDLSQSGQGLKAAFASFNNPLVSWAGLGCIVITAIQTFREKSAKALFITIGYLSQLLPWVFISRTTFAYHYFPSMLFLVLAISYAMDGMLSRRRKGARLAVYGLTGCAAGLYAAFYPVLIGLTVPMAYTTNFLRWFPSWPF